MKWAKTVLLTLLLAACSGEESVYREYACSFTFDTTLHPQPCHLTAILGNNGHFCKIEASVVQGVRCLKTTRNFDGATENIRLTTQVETQLRYELGANNCIVVGTSSYDNRLMAYEGQCANCLTEYSGTNYPLTWQNNGMQLFCAKCNLSYDVNNGVVANGPSGRQLFQYNAAFDGTILRVWN